MTDETKEVTSNQYVQSRSSIKASEDRSDDHYSSFASKPGAAISEQPTMDMLDRELEKLSSSGAGITSPHDARSQASVKNIYTAANQPPFR